MRVSTCAILVVLVAGGWSACGAPDASPVGGGVAVVSLTFAEEPFGALFGGRRGEEPAVRVDYVDIDGVARGGKAELRGFSRWHRGRTKPSVRVRVRGGADDGSAPRDIELSRPEDPLALCNVLPDWLSGGLGLLHADSRPVRLRIDGEDRGVYVRSLRPGDDLARSAGRVRGTFFKGDVIGRGALDLWNNDPDAWREYGSGDPTARRALGAMLAALREPATAASLDRLFAVLDFEKTARWAAVTALCGSLHADRIHNHMLFFDPATGRLEPVLWDANGFGVHSDPDVPIDTVLHPLTDRLTCCPRFLHRRDQVLWALLQGDGSAASLIAFADRQWQRCGAALAVDPELGSLEIGAKGTSMRVVDPAELSAARARFADYVQRREQYLIGLLRGAGFGIVPVAGSTAGSVAGALPGASAPGEGAAAEPGALGQTAFRLAVTGAVGVGIPRATGDVLYLLPGRALAPSVAYQHRQPDFEGLPVPFVAPVAAGYQIAAAGLQFERATNAVTGETLRAGHAPAMDGPTRSVAFAHANPEELPGALTLGPGAVTLDEVLVVGADRELVIAPGTHLTLRGDSRIDCHGRLSARGAPAAPIVITGVGEGPARVRGMPGAVVWVSDVTFVATSLELRSCDSTLAGCAFDGGCDVALAIGAGRAVVADCRFAAHGVAGVHAAAAATVRLLDCTFAATDEAACAVTADGGSRVHVVGMSMHGAGLGVGADSGRGFPRSIVHLEDSSLPQHGNPNVDAGQGGEVLLVRTRALARPGAAGRVRDAAQAPLLDCELAAPR